MARPGSKTAKILDLLTRPGGVTSQQLIKATGWLPHSVRGFLSGTVSKKMGLTVTSTKGDDGARTYSVEAWALTEHALFAPPGFPGGVFVFVIQIVFEVSRAAPSPA
jgi:hypothetical protein